MIRRLPTSAILLFASVLAAGCGTTPATRFYTLSPSSPQVQEQGSPRQVVQVQAVHLPPELDRPERVTRDSDVRLNIHDLEHWAAPLPDLIRQVLSQDLAERLKDPTVLPPQAPAPPGTRGIVVDIESFEPGPGNRVQLRASWMLAGRGPPAAGSGVQLTDAAPAGNADAQVASMNQLLGQLADAIARSLASAAP